MWTLLAWSTVAGHVAYLTYQTLGGLLGLRSRLWLIPHLGCVVWGVGIVVIQGSCPVTRLEKWLRVQGGGSAYPGSFLDHYLFGHLLPNGTQALVYGLHLVIIIATYVIVVRAWRRGGPRVEREGTRHETVPTSSQPS